MSNILGPSKQFIIFKYWTLTWPLTSAYGNSRGHSDAVVTHSPPTSEVRGPAPYVGKLVVVSDGRQFTVQNPLPKYDPS